MPARTEGTIALVVVEGRRELERHTVGFAAGALTGAVAVPEGTEPDVLLTLTPDDAAAVRAGELDLSVAFMRGTMKMRGDSGLLFGALPVLSTDPAAALDA